MDVEGWVLALAVFCLGLKSCIEVVERSSTAEKIGRVKLFIHGTDHPTITGATETRFRGGGFVER